MKYTLLLALGLTILSISCSKDKTDPPTGKELLLGTWKQSRVLVLYTPGKTVLSSDTIKTCDANNNWTFDTGSDYSFTSYKSSAAGCVVRNHRAGTYTFDEQAQQLTLSNITGGTRPDIFNVYQLTKKEMWFNLGATNYDGDTTNYLQILVLTRSSKK
ncbi:lipocalin family protein [Niabella drilacis]|uniref:Lipocalin-like domain-containing protein n=1 Tax=Niabella drilacis (strain DSM 25811 / CCM 8410 / CCUG 62505 / LMG 26954 / E90) TaxID=1285928 RepID=A0A1G6TDS4_NIADE|nr:lipocalin family protein [Niabella drilacis]SDD27221.1 Lipocalin-like domain-containing protein [Niabella drilacis]